MSEPPVADPPISASPLDGAARVARAVVSLESAGGAQHGLEAGGGNLTVSAPLGIFGLGVPQTASDPKSVLDRARLIGWRYLVLGPEQSLVADIRAGRDAPEILRSASLVRRLAAAGRLAEATIMDDPAYEPRLLDARLLGRSLMWMKSRDDAKPDRFFSISDEPKEIDLERLKQDLSKAATSKAAAFAKTNPETGG